MEGFELCTFTTMKKSAYLKLLAVAFMGLSLIGMASIQIIPDSIPDSLDLTKKMKTLYDFKINTLEGGPFDLLSLKGKKVLIVNTASECGLTPQYEQLQELYDSQGGVKFEILGFPCNNFGNQEPGTAEEISLFCQKNYGVSFPVMEKVHVKGPEQHPIFTWLTEKERNGVGNHEVQWNFHKFLIDEDGHLIKDLSPQVLPTDEIILNWLEIE